MPDGDLLLAADPNAEASWVLRQGDDVVGRMSTRPLRIAVAGETWDGEIRRSGRGWSAEFSRAGTGEMLRYRPRILNGGNLDLGEARYRLRTRVLGGWRLKGERGEIAKLDSIGRSGERAGIELNPSSGHESRLAVLLLASCAAMVWDAMMPHVSGDGSAGA